MQASDWGSAERTVKDDELHPHRERKALLHLPTSYSSDTPVPLIVALHGKAQPPAEFEEHTQLSNPEVQDEAIVVYPEGINLIWLGDPEAPAKEAVNDILFILALLDNLQRDFSIDKHRIYAVGFSNGGGLTDLLASDYTASGRFAAFAISSGAFYTDSALKEPLFSHANPAHIPVPLLEFHGDADPVIHYDGKSTPDGVTFGLPDFFEIWAKRNECDPEPIKAELYEGRVVRYAWHRSEGEKKQGKEVLVHYLVKGFGHGWPTKRKLNNDEQRHGPTCFEGTPIVLEWLRRFRLSDK